MNDHQKQLERFKRAARELGCDESEDRFNEKLKRIAREGGKTKPKSGKRGSEKQD